MNPFSEHLQQFPRLQGVFQENIVLDQPFECIAGQFAMEKGTVLLLSGSSSDAAQYHILAVDPWLELTSRRQTIDFQCSGKHLACQQDPFSVLSAVLERFRLPEVPCDFPVKAGLFGYFSYDLKDQIEQLPVTCRDTFLPDMVLTGPSVILIHDKKTSRSTLFIPFFEGEDDNAPRIIQKRRSFLDRLSAPVERNPFFVEPGGFESSFTRDEYVKAVEKIIAYLKSGDIYQANLSQRFEAGFTGDTYALFLDLYHRNPAAFFSYVNAGDHHIVSTSPERFIKQAGRMIETRPIKGTIARGKDDRQDTRNRRTLNRSLKDDAELTMIVDLMRNDLSRVARHESVMVREHKRLEPYENVFHLVSIVQAELLPGKTSVDLIKATFPGGSITGCPKIRSMEIIDELESVKRHVYTGSIGYISFHDTMDLSIAIRTATIANAKIFFSVGGGIVYDSDPQKEYQETLDKGKTLMEALSGDKKVSITRNVLSWIDGKMVDRESAVVSANSPGFQYGAGLFETIKVEKSTIFRLEAHLSRLNRSWQTLFSSPPPDITWETVIRQLIRENGFEDKTLAVKLMVAMDAPEKGKPFFLAAFAREYVHRLDMLNKKGLDLVTCPYPRQTFLADLKTMNYLYYDRAGNYAKTRGADEAIVLNPDRTVSETNTANILAVQGKNVIVPVSDHVLEGVTRNAVLEILSEKGFKICRKKVLIDQLSVYPNILLTNALMGAVKVLTIDANPITHEDGLCSSINQLLFDLSD